MTVARKPEVVRRDARGHLQGFCARTHGGQAVPGGAALFAVRGGGSTGTGGGQLVTLTDPSGYNGALLSSTPTILAIAPTNVAFRGVALAPHP